MHFSQEALFLLQSIILIGIPYGLWYFKLVRKLFPVVVLQVLIGILLGPSILGKINPEMFHFLFPQQSLAFINGISWIAITFFGFLTGLRFDRSDLKGKGKAFAVTSMSSLIVPFFVAIGTLIVFPQIYPLLAGPNATPILLYLAMGIIVSVTALPVLAAILIEMKMIDTPMGKTVLSYATVNDGLLWLLVSVLFVLVSGTAATGSFVAWKMFFILLYLVVMLFVVKPALKKIVDLGLWTKEHTNLELVAISILTLFSAFIGELIGIHYFLGAFLFGALIPKEIAHTIYEKKEPLIFAVLLPFFFMSIGLKTVFDITSAQIWIIFGVMTAVAVVGKFIGVVTPAALIGKMKFSQAAVLGVFMQCKGLMEIVVLTMIFNAEIINSVAFSGLIFMTLLTTAATKPVVRLIQKANRGSFA